MAELARSAANNPEFVRFVASIPDLDAFVRANYRYREEVEEIVREPEWMVNDLVSRLGYMEGDCDDIATFYAAALKILGYPVRFMAIRYNPGNPNFEHVFTQAYDGFQWRIYDGTVTPGTPISALETMTEDV